MLAAAAVGWALWAPSCGAEAAPETITLYYWGTEHDVLALELIQEFEQQHDGHDGRAAIKVIMGQTASLDRTGDPQRLLCSIVGGDPPDMVWFPRFAVVAWIVQGALESLQPFLERDLIERPDDPLTLHPEQFVRPCWEESVYQGQIYAIPLTADNRILYYNLDILDKHADALKAIGCVDPEDPTKVGPPTTWEQLKECVKVLTEFDEHGRVAQVGFIPNYGNSWLYLYGWLNGGEFISPDGRTCTLNAPEIVDALVYMTELYDLMGGYEAVNAFQSAQPLGDLDPFLSGTVAMKIDCEPVINYIASAKRDLRFGVALPPAPRGKPRMGWSGGWSFVIPKGAKHPAEAWEFIKHMVSQHAFEVRADAARQVARAAGNVYIPALSGRTDINQWAMEHYVYRDPTIEDKFKKAVRVAADTLAIARYRPKTPVSQLLWNEHVRAMEGGLYKRYDPVDLRRNARIALDKSAAVVQAELDRIYNPVPYPVIRWRPIVAGYAGILLAAAAVLYRYFNRRMQARGFFRHEFHAGYAFASPWFIGFVIFGGGPILFSLIMSFCEYDVFNPPKFVGLKNYIDLAAHDPLFYKSLWNTLFMALGIPLGMTVSLGVAMLLNYEVRGMAVYRTVFYLPAIMPVVAASILWIWIFNPHEGILNALLAKIGIAGPGWLQNQYWSKPALILMGLWGAGSGMIIWLAGLKGIPQHLYEAARLDGAGPLRCFWNVTLPMLSPYILFNLIMGLIGTFQVFTQAYVMTQGGPVDSTLFYAYALFNNAFRYLRMGYASAMAWILFGIVLALTLVQLRLSKVWVHYESGE
jgi:multiple sugar transport system permease protein